MPSFMSASKAIVGRMSRRYGMEQVMRSVNSSGQVGKFRYLSSIAGKERSCFNQLISGYSLRTMRNAVQTRQFLGCGDGEEGSILSKTYEEKIVLGYSPEQLYAVVAAVDLYEDFVPWCQRSKIVRYNDDGTFDAELEIGFKFLVESYVSHVELNKPKSIKTTASESGIFDHLINIWEFSPGPVPGTCNLHFFVDFKFQSPLYRQK
ncbi:hypothetical protein GIB67_031276 [Kingdonia uniflora]|uniref:Coenzyme Q-binding protein COQ10 START domain-containing protein n=1 Tax=Kingdonia uniflora TaxID=39325 RepID=A0A7J7P650_9MAGN|nr:hypothetical protein GIB67_031276 [Kingdonia uniflora]